MAAINVYKRFPEWLFRNYLTLGTDVAMFIELVNTNAGGSTPSVDDEYWRYKHTSQYVDYVRSLGAWWEINGDEYTLRAPNQYWPSAGSASAAYQVTHAVLTTYGPGQLHGDPFAYIEANKHLGTSPLSITWPSQGILKVTLNHG